MFVACATRTMAGAKQIVPDTGFQERARPVPVVRIVQPKPRRLPVARNDIRPHTPLQNIIDLVARMHGVSFAAVMSKSKRARICIARYAAICAIRQARPGMTLPQLGKLFGRDHTTIIHALDRRQA